MTKEQFIEKLEINPIIMAIKEQEAIPYALAMPNEIVFLLNSDIFSLQETVACLKKQEKIVFVHFDLIDGLSKSSTALKYIAEQIKPDGIITTKTSMIGVAKKLGLLTVQRHFLVDSISFKSSIGIIRDTRPDVVEILPGLITKILKQIKIQTDTPIIAGGLINDKEDVISCMGAGATAISSTNRDIWKL